MHIVSYMTHTEICHIMIKGVLQCSVYDGKVTVESNAFCCDSSVDDAAYVVLRVDRLAVYFTQDV